MSEGGKEITMKRGAAKARRGERAGAGIPWSSVVGEHLKQPGFRAAYAERLMVHQVAVAVRAMRERAGLTQAQLAEKIGSSQPSVARLERGSGPQAPQFETLQRIARALGKRIRLVFAEDDDAQGPTVEVEGFPAAGVD